MEEKQQFDLYGFLNQACESGQNVSIDFKTLTIIVGNKPIIKNGEPISDFIIKSHWEMTIEAYSKRDIESTINRLQYYYSLYKHSIPSANEPSRPYFKALKYDELSDKSKSFGMSRSCARFNLEYEVFMVAKTNKLQELFKDGYFWRSKQDPDFVIMKSWFNL